MVCKQCGSKQFLVNIVNQVNGNDDTYEFVCGGCGDCIDLPEFDDYTTYLVKEIASFENHVGSICLEEWVEEGVRLYYISLYKGEELVFQQDFNTIDEARACYKKCIDIFATAESFDPIIGIFDSI
jgi:hypothetical protein